MTVFPNQAAIDYDNRITNLVPGYALALELFGSTLAGQINPQGSILVPGCGTGSEILALAGVFPEAVFTAVEPSFAMQEKARARITEAGISDRVEIFHGFLEDTPERFHDAATISLVLHFLPDDGAKAAFLTSVARRLAPERRFFFSMRPAEKMTGFLRRWLEGRGMHPARQNAICNRMATEWHRITPERLDDLLENTGFTGARAFLNTPGYTGLVAEKRHDA